MPRGEISGAPSFSIVIETANLELADHWRLEASLVSLAAQQPSPECANEVVLIDSGEAPPELIERCCGNTLGSGIIRSLPALITAIRNR